MPQGRGELHQPPPPDLRGGAGLRGDREAHITRGQIEELIEEAKNKLKLIHKMTGWVYFPTSQYLLLSYFMKEMEMRDDKIHTGMSKATILLEIWSR
ncbi:hypothetical protein KSP40_PGU022304 [Platanthera guangdongensis]|uniref:Uncharacterized protein n=1 Tax=Platanthera guangdongensis TaxID=2320717 RepID=A0ABR2MSV6_9ASPA